MDFIKALDCILCNLDYPTGPNSFTLDGLTHSTGYVRLYGRISQKWFSKSTRDETYNYYYSKKELKEIAKNPNLFL